MQELLDLYQNMGLSPAVYHYGEAAIEKLTERFAQIDRVAEYNQAKVLGAMQKNKVSATCFAGTTGYGSMRMYSIRKPHWYVLRSPAAPML